MNILPVIGAWRGVRRRRRGSLRAFTLVELLVSTTCLLMLVVFLARLLSQANNS